MINLKSKKRSHVEKVRDHIFSLHMKMTRIVKDLHELSDIELYQKAEEMRSLSGRMNELKEYLRLILL